jgi:polyhydroxyalkanoate synthesis regulator phasin
MLTSALRESRGYLQDQGWHQTARLMSVAAEEIERLSERVRDLENEAGRPTLPSPLWRDSA